MHKNQAIVAIARHLLELALSETDRDGLTRQQFTRYCLMRLGIGHDLEQIALNPRYKRRLASEADVLALRPELSQAE